MPSHSTDNAIVDVKLQLRFESHLCLIFSPVISNPRFQLDLSRTRFMTTSEQGHGSLLSLLSPSSKQNKEEADSRAGLYSSTVNPGVCLQTHRRRRQQMTNCCTQTHPFPLIMPKRRKLLKSKQLII